MSVMHIDLIRIINFSLSHNICMRKFFRTNEIQIHRKKKRRERKMVNREEKDEREEKKIWSCVNVHISKSELHCYRSYNTRAWHIIKSLNDFYRTSFYCHFFILIIHTYIHYTYDMYICVYKLDLYVWHYVNYLSKKTY